MQKYSRCFVLCVLFTILIVVFNTAFAAESDNVFYTVDFDYNGAKYSLPGGESILLSDLFSELGIEQDVSNVADVNFSDETLLSITSENNDFRLTSLKPFETEETLGVSFLNGNRILVTVVDKISEGWMGDGYWVIEDDGTLIIRPKDTILENDGVAVITINYHESNNWPWKSYANKIKKVVIEGKIQYRGGGNPHFKNIFNGLTNLEEVDTSGLVSFDHEWNGNLETNASFSSRVQDMSGMFRNLTKLKKVDLSGFTSPGLVWDMKNMFNGCTSLETVILNNPNFITRGGTDGKDGPQLLHMFSGCSKLKEVDLSNITIYGRKNGAVRDDSGMAEYPSHEFSALFKGLKNLQTVNLSNTKVPQMKNFRSMFQDCTNLTYVNMTGFEPSDAVIMDAMFMNCTKLTTLDISSFGKLEHIESMGNFFGGCSALKKLVMDDFDNSNISDETIAYEDNGSRQGKAVKINGYTVGSGRALGWDDLDNLEYLSAKKSKLYVVKPQTREAGDFPYWGALGENETGNIPYIFNQNYDPDENDIRMYYYPDMLNEDQDDYSESILLNKREWIDLLTDRWQVTNGSQNYGGTNHGPDWSTNPNVAANIGGTSDNGHTNTNGAGFLAPGVYEISYDKISYFNERDLPKTYYRIDSIGYYGSPEVYIGGTNVMEFTEGVYDQDSNSELGGLRIRITGDGDEKLLEISSPIFEYYDVTSQNDFKLEIPKIEIIYPQAATSIYGEQKGVKLTITGVTFKDQNRIPLAESYPFTTCKDDPDQICDSNMGHVLSDDPDSQESGSWFRRLFAISSSELQFRDYLRKPTGNDPFAGEYLLSNGSGSEVEFTIEIVDPVPDSSLLFFIDDLDVAASQEWNRKLDAGKKDPLNSKPVNMDVLPWSDVTYGSGSESIVLGAGNDLNTVTFANHTGLELVGNEILPTGNDQTTAWSAAYVRADASGAQYTWKNGIGCTTYLLKNINPAELEHVYVLPEVWKTVNGLTPKDKFADGYFDFIMSDASSDEDLETVDQGILDVLGIDTELTIYNNLYDNAPYPSLGEFVAEPIEGWKRSNNGQYIYFGYLEFKPYDWDTSQPTKEAYVYKFTEIDPNKNDVIRYDKNTTYYMQIIVSAPVTDDELQRGTKAEIFFGEKHSDSDTIHWNYDNYETVWSAIMQPEKDADDPYTYITISIETKQTDSGFDERQVFVDGQNRKFFRANGNFYDPDSCKFIMKEGQTVAVLSTCTVLSTVSPVDSSQELRKR